MTSPSSGYRAVCELCQTVIVSSTEHGRFANYAVAVMAMHAHLKHHCEKANPNMKQRYREILAESSVEAIKGAA